MGFLTGKAPKQESSSKNLAYPYLQSTLSPIVSQAGVGGSNLLASILGIGDPAAGQAGFNQYKKLGGFDFANERGQGGVVANAAARGFLNSGKFGKDLTSFTTGLQNQYLSDYLSKVLGFSGLGLQSAGIIGGAGQTSNQTSKGGKPGLLSLGAMAAGI